VVVTRDGIGGTESTGTSVVVPSHFAQGAAGEREIAQGQCPLRDRLRLADCP